VAAPLEAEGLDPKKVQTAAGALIKQVLGSSKKDSLQTGQIVVLGVPELAYLRDLTRQLVESNEDSKKMSEEAKELLKTHKKNLGALGNAAGLDAALFGRMVTSDYLSRGDAAIHVAHAFTVHAEQAEDDYFSAIDDLLGEISGDEESRGSGHIGNNELTSGLFYSYVVVDVPLLISNLTGVSQADWLSADRALAAEVVARLVRLIATVSPGAKLGSTAPYAHAAAVLVEAGDAQPRTLANAFSKPVRGDDLIAASYKRMGQFIGDNDIMYDDMVGSRALAALGDTDALRAAVKADDDVKSLSQLARWVSERITQ
jgi:CRISPR system Cascade subunit CasC